MKIGYIAIDSSAKIKPLVSTRDKEGKIVFQNIVKRVTDELSECISTAASSRMIDINSIPVQDVVTVVIKKLDQVRGLYHESFHYEYNKSGDRIKFTLFWN